MNLLDKYPIISGQITRQELQKILSVLQDAQRREIAGDVVEFGCYAGTTSLFLQRMLLQEGRKRQLHVYDSFEGLPPKSAQDASPAGEQFRPGELHASKRELVRHFKHAGLPLPVIHKAWFDQLQPHELPARIAFAFLDGDFYQSIQASLRLVWPRLSAGAVVIVDDYQSEALPGAKRAVDEWLATH